MQPRNLAYGLFTLIFAFAFNCIASAQTTTPHAKAAKPDLHAGGFNPSSIVNGVVTDVTLPGSHFTGARVETEPICKLISYEVVSDTEIHMKLKGTRGVDDKEWQCGITVRTAAGSASSWIGVKLADAEEKERSVHEKAEGMAKMEAFRNRTGKSWRLSFGGGPPVTYTLTRSDPDKMPTFKSDSGKTLQISVTNDNRVLILEQGCMRGGALVGNEVKDGVSQGNCTPGGAWTGSVSR